MTVSYIKTQWWRLLIGVVCLVIACTYIFSPAIDESTIEGLNKSIETMLAALAWFLYFVFWLIMSFVSYNEDCIRELDKKNKELEKRIEALENRAITDIEELRPNHFAAVRRLGPDKGYIMKKERSASNEIQED